MTIEESFSLAVKEANPVRACPLCGQVEKREADYARRLRESDGARRLRERMQEWRQSEEWMNLFGRFIVPASDVSGR